LRNKPAQNTPAADNEQKQEGFGDKISLRNEVLRIRVQKLAVVPKNLETANCSVTL
jgi:hypothetical protein